MRLKKVHKADVVCSSKGRTKYTPDINKVTCVYCLRIIKRQLKIEMDRLAKIAEVHIQKLNTVRGEYTKVIYELIPKQDKTHWSNKGKKSI
jgi:hypothetical protein